MVEHLKDHKYNANEDVVKVPPLLHHTQTHTRRAALDLGLSSRPLPAGAATCCVQGTYANPKPYT